MKKIAILATAAALLGLLLGCSLTPSAATSDTGSLTLTFAQYGVKGAKDFLPPVDMNIASYDVQGSGPGGAAFSQLGVTSSTLTVSSLVTGNWTISVDAWNGANPRQKIAAGSVGVAISGGQTASATVTCTPLSGTGTLAVNISWPSGIIVSPSISASLAPQGGSPAAFPLALALDGLSASGTDANCSAGYHSLSITIKDGAQEVYWLTSVVRIIAGSTTTATITLTASEITRAVGGVNLAVTPDLQNPITIGFSGQQAVLAQGSSMTVTAAPSVAVDTYQWYLNNIALAGATNPSVTIGSSLLPGNYSLDLVVSKPNILSSGHVGFKVQVPVASPGFSPAGGTYSSDQSVALSCATAGAVIHYTTDGSTPTSASLAYSTPIAVSGVGTSMTIKAIAVKTGMIDSPVASATYTITNVVFSRPPSGAALAYVRSSWVPTGDLGGDEFAYDSFTLAADAAIHEVRWRGCYPQDPYNTYGLASNFDVTFYASIAGGSQPDCTSPMAQTGADSVYLAKYTVGGNAGETLGPAVNGIQMYDYDFVLPTAFNATAGVKYWVKIEASMPSLPTWFIAAGTGGDNSYYRFLYGTPSFFATIPGYDTSFSLLK